MFAAVGVLCACSPQPGPLARRPPRSAPVAVAAWRAVVKDWYDDGRFEGQHSCDAVHEAMKHVPRDTVYSNPLGALRRYARRVC